MRFPKNDDLKLARRAADGDAQALEAIYARYADALHAYVAHRLGGRREDVEDVWQDALLAMLKSLPTYNGRSRFFTWLCGIAGHKIADHIRRKGRSQETADFPVGVLAVLAAMLAVVTMLLGLRSFGLIGWAISSVPLAIATWLVYANLVTVPVAGILIVLRRRACQS